MAQHEEITNLVLKSCLDKIISKHFTTFKVVSILEKNYPEVIEIVKSNSERNWKAVIGKAIKRFSVETNLIKQISSVDESPARWEKN